MPNSVMIIEIFISQSDPDYSLGKQVTNSVLNSTGGSVISKALSKSLNDPTAPNHLPKKKASRIGRNIAAVKCRDDSTATICLKIVRFRFTVCHGQLISFRVLRNKKVTVIRQKSTG
jgi:hypothetical protein